MEQERAPCPDCGEMIVSGAKVCRFCGRGLQSYRAAGARQKDGRSLLLVLAAIGLLPAAALGAWVAFGPRSQAQQRRVDEALRRSDEKELRFHRKLADLESQHEAKVIGVRVKAALRARANEREAAYMSAFTSGADAATIARLEQEANLAKGEAAAAERLAAGDVAALDVLEAAARRDPEVRAALLLGLDQR